MSRTLFVTDLDGTLLGPDSRVCRESARIITDLTRQGALITVATARTPATVEPLLRDICTAIPAIVLTGAAMWDRAGRRFIDPMTLPAADAGRLESRFLRHGIQPFVYRLMSDGTMQVLHSPALTADEERFYLERSQLELKKFVFRDGPFCFTPTESSFSCDNKKSTFCHDTKKSPGRSASDANISVAGPYDDAPVILMLGIGDTPSVERLAAELRTDAGLSVSAYPDIFDPTRSYIEVFRAGISKAAAVLRLKEMVGADRLVVYGDHLNDLPMFAVADESVAVANALPQVRAAATRTIPANTTPSVPTDMAEQFNREGC